MEALTNYYKVLNRSQKLYLFSITCLLLSIITNPVLMDMSKGFLSLALLITLIALIKDGNKIYKIIWSHNLGKGIMLVLYALLANICFALGDQFVNDALGVEPTTFKYVRVYASILILPFLVISVALIVQMIVVIGSGVYFFIAWLLNSLVSVGILSEFIPERKERFWLLTAIVRVIVLSIFINCLHQKFLNNSNDYEKFVKSSIVSFVYFLESYSKSRCILAPEQRIVPLLNDEILVLYPLANNSYQISLKQCVPAITHNKAFKSDS
ncbi:hypothetical protein [Vibrio hyugaensis]|uniref:hypothetical protein n=1 Tax=Vibrio hyugaensis TaxID=1534743 RepID=UPI0005F01C46|nr:hypothetical protein [Vibrio hyugaensis]